MCVTNSLADEKVTLSKEAGGLALLVDCCMALKFNVVRCLHSSSHEVWVNPSGSGRRRSRSHQLASDSHAHS